MSSSLPAHYLLAQNKPSTRQTLVPSSKLELLDPPLKKQGQKLSYKIHFEPSFDSAHQKYRQILYN